MRRKLRKLDPHKVILDGDWPEDKALTGSIASTTQLHPVHVYPGEVPGEYPIIAGRGRVMSCRALGIKVEAFVYANEMEGMHFVQLAENVRRRNPLSDARAIAKMTREEALAHGGINTSQYRAAKRLLDLTDTLLDKLEIGHLPVTAAKKLCRLSKDQQARAAEIAQGLNEQGRNRPSGPTIKQWDKAIREVKFEKQKPLAYQIGEWEGVPITVIEPQEPNYMAILGSLYQLTDKCPHDVLQPMIEWLQEQ